MAGLELTRLDDMVELKNFKQAAASYDWIHAMEKEIQALICNNTGQWVYKIKRKAYGSIERKKARLVAQGSSQVEGVDFDETYSLIIKFLTIYLNHDYTGNFTRMESSSS